MSEPQSATLPPPTPDEIDWEQIFSLRQQGQLAPQHEEALQKAIQAGKVPPAYSAQLDQQLHDVPSSTILDPNAAMLRAATPVQTRQAQLLPPYPPMEGEQGASAYQTRAKDILGVVPKLPEPPNPWQETQPLKPEYAAWAQEHPWLDTVLRQYPEQVDAMVYKYGKQILGYTPPIFMALLSRNLSPMTQAGLVGGTAALSQYATHTPTLLPIPGTPEAKEAEQAGQEALRTGLITATTMGAQSLVPLAQPGAPLSTQVLQHGKQIVAGLLGSGAGSLASEVVDPTKRPLETAGLTAAQMGALDTGIRLFTGGAHLLLGPARFLKPEYAKALDILKEENIPPTGHATYNVFTHAAEDIAEGSLRGGSVIRRQRAANERQLSDRIDAFLDEATFPVAPGQREAMTAAGWDEGLRGETGHGNLISTIRNLYAHLSDEIANTFYRRNNMTMPVPRDVQITAGDVLSQTIAGTPEHAALQQIATSAAIPLADAVQALRTLRAYQPGATALPATQRRALDDTVDRLARSIHEPAFVNLSPLMETIRDLRHQIRGRVSPEVQLILDRFEPNIDAPLLTAQETNTLRSELLALGRRQEPGGASRAPSPAGNPAGPGEGGPFADILQQQAQRLARSVDTVLKQQLRRLDPLLVEPLDAARSAARLKEQQEAVTRFFYDDPAIYHQEKIIDPATGREEMRGVFNGEAIKTKIQSVHGGEQNLKNELGADAVERIKDYADALTLLQRTSAHPANAFGHQLLRYGTRFLVEPTGSIVAAGSGHPLLATSMIFIPESLGKIFTTEPLARLLIAGMRAPKNSQQAALNIGKVLGALAADNEGMDITGIPPATTASTRVSPVTETPAPVPTSAIPAAETEREEKALQQYRQELAEPAFTKDAALQVWQHIRTLEDAAVRSAFMKAYKERFQQWPGE